MNTNFPISLLRRVSIGILALLPLGASLAYADVSPGQVNFDPFLSLPQPDGLGHGSQTVQSSYATMIGSLRSAAAHSYRNGVMITQQQQTTGLIRVRFASGGNQVDIWITPQDLYVRGFTNQFGTTYQFNDQDYNLLSALDILGQAPQGGGSTLAFGSNYNSITNAANRGRENTPFNYTSFFASFLNLATTTDPFGDNQQNVARSLMVMIQMTSEAARFNDVFGVAHDSMGTGNYGGLPLFQQYLENNWGTISNYGLAVTQNPSTPNTTVQGINPDTGNNPGGQAEPFTLTSFGDVIRFLAVMNTAPFGASTGGINEDWNHTEL
jgi:hypothetical protein